MDDGNSPYYNTPDISDFNRPQRIVLTLFLLLVCAFGVFFGVGGWNQSRVESAIRTSGVHTPGFIADRYAGNNGNDAGTNYTIIVQYKANGIPADHKFVVNKDAYYNTYGGSTAEVIFEKDDPSVAILASGGDTQGGSTNLMVGAIITIVTLTAILALWIYWKRQ